MTSGFSRSRRKVKLLLRIRVRELLLSLERKELEFENEEFNHAPNQGAIVRDGVAGGAGVKLYVAMRTFQVPPSWTLTDAK